MEKKGDTPIRYLPRTVGSREQVEPLYEERKYLEGGSLFIGVIVGSIISLVLGVITRPPREEV